MLGFSNRIDGKNLFLQYEQCQNLSLPDIANQLNNKLSSPYDVEESIIVSTSNKSKVFCYFLLTEKSKRIDTDPSFFNIEKTKASGLILADGYPGFCNRVISELGDIEEELSFFGSEQLFKLLNQKRSEYQTEMLSNKFLKFEEKAEENDEHSIYSSSNICRSPILGCSYSDVPSRSNSLSENSKQKYEERIQVLLRETSEKEAKYQALENKSKILESQLENMLVFMKQLQSSNFSIENSQNVLQRKMDDDE